MNTRPGLWSLVTLTLGLASLAHAADRELGAHQHGHGTVNMVIEGSDVWIELEAPGADIVGFEHAARSAEDEAAIEAATARLADPLSLFDLGADATCTLEDSNVDLRGQEVAGEDVHDDEETEGHGHEDDAAHSAFRAEYHLTCAEPEAIREIGFSYFASFPQAEALDVTVIVGESQSRYEVGKDTPLLRLRDD